MVTVPPSTESGYRGSIRRGRLPSVNIQGDGVAATCCAYLLSETGCDIAFERTPRPRLPALLLNDAALALIRDIFRNGDLFRNSIRVRRRIVAWGQHAEAVRLAHSAVVVSEDTLLQTLQPKRDPSSRISRDRPADWTLFASRPCPPGASEHAFGSQVAFAASVRLRDSSEQEACWIESLEDGWLFLISGLEGLGSLLSVGAPPNSLLGHSRLIVRQVASMSESATQFPAYPRIASPLCGPMWLACGSAAMAFDPICGDGTAYAIREAILAAAVIRAAPEKLDEQLLLHYEARLTAAFRRHLLLCREFYASGACGPWWEMQLEGLQKGIAWCDRKLQGFTGFEYRLAGFDLLRV